MARLQGGWIDSRDAPQPEPPLQALLREKQVASFFSAAHADTLKEEQLTLSNRSAKPDLVHTYSKY